MTATLSESEFTRMVIDLAHLRGFRVAHFRPGMDRRGNWQTAVSGDGAGFPDLFLVRGETALAFELKVGRNKPTAEQTAWLTALSLAGIAGFVFTPNDWPNIEALLA